MPIETFSISLETKDKFISFNNFNKGEKNEYRVYRCKTPCKF